MQYATIHIQANPFVSIWFSRFENCNFASIVDNRYESLGEETPTFLLCLHSTLSNSPLAASLCRRYGVLVEEKRNQRGNCIVLRFWFEPIVTNNGRSRARANGEQWQGSMNSSDDRDRWFCN